MISNQTMIKYLPINSGLEISLEATEANEEKRRKKREGKHGVD